MNEEQRKHKRYEIENDTFVSCNGNIGKIRNISMGGVFCRCVGNEGPKEDACIFDIFCADEDIKLKLKKVPVTIIKKHLDQDALCKTTLARRCNVMFDQLAPEQTSQLENFIEHYAVE